MNQDVPFGMIAVRLGAAVALVASFTACEGREGAEPDASGPLFTELPPSATGVTFHNDLEENPVMNGFTYEYFYNGGGVAAGDLTGNGYPDLYFTGNLVPNRLYLNRGDMRFEDVTLEAGVEGHQGWATGVTFADVNGNGLLDIYVGYSGAYEDTELRRNQLFINQGTRDGIPRFTEEAARYGLDDPGMTTQAAFFDSNGNGLLDVYVMNHGVAGYHSMEELLEMQSPHAVDRFYRNEGGHFVDVSEEVGIVQNDLGYGLGLSVGDFNNNGLQDFYVANDYAGRDFLYLGRPDGTFDEVLEEAMPHIPYAAMGSDVADIDGDGWLDLVVLEMAMEDHYGRAMSESGIDDSRFAHVVEQGQHYQYVSNALQWNRGTNEEGVPVFSEVAQLAGVHQTDWSWAALLADLTNSGRPDLFVTNGIPRDMIHRDFHDYRDRRVEEVVEAEGRVTHSLIEELLEEMPRRKVPNRVFRNDGDLDFADVSEAWGLDEPTFSYGAVHVDLDRDGDLDLVVNNLMQDAAIYRNETRERTGHGYLAVQLEGPEGNRFGVGARVRLVADGRQQLQEMQLTRGYQSSVEPVLHFGLGEADRVDTLEVRWPDGARQVLTDVEADRYITVDRGEVDGVQGSGGGEGMGPKLPRESPFEAEAEFTEASGALSPAPRHHARVATEDPSVRSYPAEREKLALAAGDLTGTGLDDFIYGGSEGEPAAVYLQEPDGSFRGRPLPPPSGSLAPWAVAAAILDATGDGRGDVWLVHEDDAGGERPLYGHRLLLQGGDGGFQEAPASTLPEGLESAAAVLAPGDFDGDGSVDLFVGEWTAPGHPVGAGSRLLRNEGGVFRDVTDEVAPGLRELTTVTDAAWTDLHGDGREDLVVVGQWLPVTVWRNEEEALVDATEAEGLDHLTGWWESVTPADFTGDGRMDLVAGNVGLNLPWVPSRERPFELYVDDFVGDGARQALPAYYEEGHLYPWIHRNELAEKIPFVVEEYPTHHLFAQATLPEIVGPEALGSARRLGVAEAGSVLLRNTGEGFEVTSLPRAAQVSPVNDAVAADFTGDGELDLVVGGNLYELALRAPRIDAGVGLFLRGDGKGGFEPVMPQESGVLLPGRVRKVVPISDGTDGPPGLLVGVVGEGVRYIRPPGAEGGLAEGIER